MSFDFLSSFNILETHLLENVPEIGKIKKYWDDPFSVSRNQSMLLPSSHVVSNSKIDFDLVLWISVVEKKVELISETQMNIMQKLFSVINRKFSDKIISSSITAADYFDPTPQAPNVGILRVSIGLTVEYFDDCMEG